MSDTCVS
ncbi:hypothetical protein QLX08_009915 [Tetragonisca angustula]